jgi:hypothetical protein
MPKLSELIAERGDEIWTAFEYFPPRTQDGVNTLYKRFARMATQSASHTPEPPLAALHS